MRRAGPRAAARRAEARRRRLLAGGGLAVVLVAALALTLARTGPPEAGPAAGGPDPLAAAYAAPIRGDPQAKVTIVEYGDFQCPSCGAFARGVEPELLRRYVDTGKARLVFKHFPWIGSESKLAAQAAACAGTQGRFWEYHDWLYAHQRGENSGAFSAANLKGFASALRLDRTAFDACFDGGTYRAAVERDFAETRALGLNATPTFVIDGTRIVGAQPLSVFVTTIEQKLAAR